MTTEQALELVGGWMYESNKWNGFSLHSNPDPINPNNTQAVLFFQGTRNFVWLDPNFTEIFKDGERVYRTEDVNEMWRNEISEFVKSQISL